MNNSESTKDVTAEMVASILDQQRPIKPPRRKRKKRTGKKKKDKSTPKKSRVQVNLNDFLNSETAKNTAKRVIKKYDQKQIDKATSPKSSSPHSKSTNKDGFPIEDCYYEESFGDWVYQPPGYGDVYCKDLSVYHDKEITVEDLHFCKHCLLRPCITKVHGADMIRFSFETPDPVYDVDHRDMVVTKTYNLIESYMGQQYMERNGLPHCVIEHIKWACDDESDSDIDSDIWNAPWRYK